MKTLTEKLTKDKVPAYKMSETQRILNILTALSHCIPRHRIIVEEYMKKGNY